MSADTFPPSPEGFVPTELDVACYMTGRLGFTEYLERQTATYAERYGQDGPRQLRKRGTELIRYLSWLHDIGYFDDAQRH